MFMHRNIFSEPQLTNLYIFIKFLLNRKLCLMTSRSWLAISFITFLWFSRIMQSESMRLSPKINSSLQFTKNIEYLSCESFSVTDSDHALRSCIKLYTEAFTNMFYLIEDSVNNLFAIYAHLFGNSFIIYFPKNLFKFEFNPEVAKKKLGIIVYTLWATYWFHW